MGVIFDARHRRMHTGRMMRGMRCLLRGKPRGCCSHCSECALLCSRRQHVRGDQTTLDRLRVGEQGEVLAVAPGDEQMLSRLADRGLVKGAGVKVQQQALFGGPILIAVQGSMMALRRSEAALIEVKCL